MTDQTNKLKPCPFCGGKAHLNGDGRNGFFVGCASTIEENCFAANGENYDGYAMPDHRYQDSDSAIAAWNRRASASEADQEAYEQECLNMAAEGIKYWKDKYEALVAASAPAAGSVPSDEANESTRNGGHDE